MAGAFEKSPKGASSSIVEPTRSQAPDIGFFGGLQKLRAMRECRRKSLELKDLNTSVSGRADGRSVHP
jgi:hypothetical protein